MYLVYFDSTLESPTNVAVSALQALYTTIDSFSNLPPGWHFGVGVAPSQEIIKTAKWWCTKLFENGFGRSEAFPGASGEIMVTGFIGANRVEVIIEFDHTISYSYEKNGRETIERDHATDKEAQAAFQQTLGDIWITSGSFTQGTTRLKNAVSLVWHFGTMEAARPSLPISVSSIAEPHYVNISGTLNTSPALQAIPRYSGYSAKTRSQMALQ